MAEVSNETVNAGPGIKAGKYELVDDHRGETAQRDAQRVMVKQRDAQQRRRKQYEIDRDAEQRGTTVADTVCSNCRRTA